MNAQFHHSIGSRNQIQIIQLDDFNQVRIELLSIFNHRRRTLNMKPYFSTKSQRVDVVESLIRKFENLTKCTEEKFWYHVKDQSIYMIYMYSQDTRYVKQRQKLLTIVEKALKIQK